MIANNSEISGRVDKGIGVDRWKDTSNSSLRDCESTIACILLKGVNWEKYSLLRVQRQCSVSHLQIMLKPTSLKNLELIFGLFLIII